MVSRKLLVLRFIISIAVSCVAIHSLAETPLERIERSLESESSIEHLDVEIVLNKMLIGENPPVLFDVRSEEEFAVSHLNHAIRLAPDTDPQAFLDEYGALLEKRTVIFYCAVGGRSTVLAEKVAGLQNALGKSKTPMNMKGGIFHWHNESLPLTNAQGKTDYVHPFSWSTKRLLDREGQAVYVLNGNQ